MRTCRAEANARGDRLDQFLARAYPELTRSRLKDLIEDGRASTGDRVLKASYRMRGLEEIRLVIPAPVQSELTAEDLPLSVLFEDRDLLVIDKAPGMVVHPAAGHADGTLVNALLHHVKDLQAIGGELRPGIVHRLDRDTSGCLVVAKNEQALVALQAEFKARRTEKTYLAIAQAKAPVPAEWVRIETLYGRHPIHRKKFTGKVREGKQAVTEYRALENFPGAALLEIRLLTGRTHQIRVHLSEGGLPLLGDDVYGKTARGSLLEARDRLDRQALHAWKLSFKHPRTGKERLFEAPIPADFEAALQLLRDG